MDEGTVKKTREQLVGRGVWVQVAEIFKAGHKFRNPHASEKENWAVGQGEIRGFELFEGSRLRVRRLGHPAWQGIFAMKATCPVTRIRQVEMTRAVLNFFQ
jgi:hypothetical protein